MSESELKRWYLWYDIANRSQQVNKTPHPNRNHVEVISVYDHDRIVAELNARLDKVNDVYKMWVKELETIAELRAEVERTIRRNVKLNEELAFRDAMILDSKKTIATQARVIEIAKRFLQNAGLRPPDGGAPTVETICEDLNDAIKEIVAIETAATK